MDESQEKAGGNTHKSAGFGRKTKDRFTHRTNKRSEKEESETQAPKGDEPISFHAHALDMDAEVEVPERPSLDLTYNDFTRGSYEAAGKPFVPKKKQNVPFELSDTPHMQTEYWEGKAPGRRKLLNHSDNTVSSEGKQEQHQQGEQKTPNSTGDSTEKSPVNRIEKPKGRAQDKREGWQPKPDKSKLPRTVQAKNPSAAEAKPVNQPDTVADGNARRPEPIKTGRNLKRRGNPIPEGDGKRPEQDKASERVSTVDHRKTRGRDVTKAVIGDGERKGNAPADSNSGDTKESLMRPYWMKKKK